jgi:hypothetical protein
MSFLVNKLKAFESHQGCSNKLVYLFCMKKDLT